MSDEKEKSLAQNPEEKPESPLDPARIEKEQEEGLYGWKFHRGPLLAAVILTVLFYIFVFLWVD
jgi:hypothetical protein